jgi:hypothetical protein
MANRGELLSDLAIPPTLLAQAAARIHPTEWTNTIPPDLSGSAMRGTPLAKTRSVVVRVSKGDMS